MNNTQILLQYAVKLLSKRRYTVYQLKRKLLQKKLATTQEIDALIERLQKLKYLDDELFTELFIEDALRRKPQGIMMVKNSLIKKGIEPQVIAKKLELKTIDEMEVAKKASEKKLQTLQRFSHFQQKEKLYRFLLSRGFPQNTIFKVLSGHFSEIDEF